jgi:hypothetical protein
MLMAAAPAQADPQRFIGLQQDDRSRDKRQET